MIRIYKDNDVKVVTQGAYKTFYKPLGYNIVIENTVEVEEPKIKNFIEPTTIVAEQKKAVTKNKRSSRLNKNKKED